MVLNFIIYKFIKNVLWTTNTKYTGYFKICPFQYMKKIIKIKKNQILLLLGPSLLVKLYIYIRMNNKNNNIGNTKIYSIMYRTILNKFMSK